MPLKLELRFRILGTVPITVGFGTYGRNICMVFAVCLLRMAKIDVAMPIRAPPKTVWEIVSDLDAEPKFWKGTKSVRNISKDGNRIRREITIAFRDQKCIQDVTLYPPDRIDAQFVEGIIKGNKEIVVAGDENSTTLNVTWNISLSGMMRMFTGMITGHIEEGTRRALVLIKNKAEGKAE